MQVSRINQVLKGITKFNQKAKSAFIKDLRTESPLPVCDQRLYNREECWNAFENNSNNLLLNVRLK